MAAVLLMAGVTAVALRTCQDDSSTQVRRVGSTWEPLPGEFAGAEACAECHAEIHERQSASAHGQTLRSLANQPARSPFGNGQGVVDLQTGARYEMVRRGDACAVFVQRAGVTAEQEVHFEFGSGRRAHAYVADLGNGEFLDSRLNYYRASDGWDFTSGQEKPLPTLVEQPLGRPLSRTDTALCFSCHTTVLRARGVTAEGTPADAVQLDLHRSVLGIHCERCHGPRAEHVRRRRAGELESSPAPMSAETINRLCGECHTPPEVDPADPALARFQPYGLERSRCYQESKGKLSCMTCHDPHDNAQHYQDYYDLRCLSCHSREVQPADFRITLCSAGKKDNCVSCHMPRDDASMLHIVFTDHRIRKPGRP